MFLSAAHTVDVQAVEFKVRLGLIEARERIIRNGKQFGRLERRCGLQLDREPRHLAYHLLIGRDAVSSSLRRCA